MKLGSKLVGIYITLLLISQNEVRGGILDLLNPIYWVNLVGKVLNSTNIISLPKPTTETTTVAAVDHTVVFNFEESHFKLASSLQSFFDPGDIQATENYIMSPLSTDILLGQLLMGTDGWNHDYLAAILGLDTTPKRANRSIRRKKKKPIVTTDSSVDKIEHSSYHSLLNVLGQKEQSNEKGDQVHLANALFYAKNTKIYKSFQKKTKEFYDTEMIQVASGTNSADPIYDWSFNNLQVRLNHSTNLVPQDMGSILVNDFLLNTKWKTPLKKLRKKRTFTINPLKTVDTAYLQGIVNNTIYVENDEYIMTAIPLNHKNTYLYILLPNGNDYTNYNIRRFSESLTDNKQLQDTMKNLKEMRDIKLKLPNIFSQFVELDLIKPLLNYINDENELSGKPREDFIQLNGAAANLKINNALQHICFSITNNQSDKPGKSTTPDSLDLETTTSDALDLETSPNLNSKVASTKHIKEMRATESVTSSFVPSQYPAGHFRYPGSTREVKTLHRPIDYSRLPLWDVAYSRPIKSALDTTNDNGRIERDVEDSEPKNDNVVNFEVTRPFVFIIMDLDTKLLLVWGSISDPTKLEE